MNGDESVRCKSRLTETANTPPRIPASTTSNRPQALDPSLFKALASSALGVVVRVDARDGRRAFEKASASYAPAFHYCASRDLPDVCRLWMVDETQRKGWQRGWTVGVVGRARRHLTWTRMSIAVRAPDRRSEFSLVRNSSPESSKASSRKDHHFVRCSFHKVAKRCNRVQLSVTEGLQLRRGGPGSVNVPYSIASRQDQLLQAFVDSYPKCVIIFIS